MTSAKSVVMPMMRVPSGIGDSAAIIAFSTWQPYFGSVMIRPRSTVLVVSSVLFLLLRFGVDLRGMRTFAHKVILFWCLQRGPADINVAEHLAFRLLCQHRVQRFLPLATVGYLVQHFKVDYLPL